eukprot:gi/632955383/ref/XP_007893437.1/ PREDICTED: protocadherin Fat 4-like [Callorhinchus milii]
MNNLSVKLTQGSFSCIICAPTISGVNPLNLNLNEDAKTHHVLTNITVDIPAEDKLDGDPIIINCNPARCPFEIIPHTTNTWNLVTTNTPELDFETTRSYTLQLLVQDRKGSSASQTIVINVIDVNEPPNFLGTLAKQDVEIYIPEDSAINIGIYDVSVEDPDENNVLKYSLLGTTDFGIDSTGLIFITKALNYENTTNSYSLTVMVEDQGNLSITGSVKVFVTDVNDNSPVLACTMEHPEPVMKGLKVVELNCMDSDNLGDTLAFIPKSGPLGPGDIFEQTAEAGHIIQVGAKTLDYDDEDVAHVGHMYLMTVAVSDAAVYGHTVTATVIVEVTPINDFTPKFENNLYTFNVFETELVLLHLSSATCEEVDLQWDLWAAEFTLFP